MALEKRSLEEREQRYEDFRRRVEIPMLVAALLVVPVILMPLVEDLSEQSERQLWMLGVAIWAVFVLEYVLLLVFSVDRRETIRTHKLELLMVVLPMFRPLRLLRLLQVGAGFSIAARVFKRIGLRPGFGATFAVVISMILLGGLLVSIAEDEQPGSTIDGVGDGLWWAFVTCTTVGYGDEFPVTTTGRSVAVLLMLAGISGLSVITANVAAYFVANDTEEEVDSLEIRLDRIEEQLSRISSQLESRHVD